MPTARITCPEEAARILRAGGLVAFPTETVFGLGVDATNGAAVERLFAAKGRPSDNPLIVHLASREGWPLAASELTRSADALLRAFAPGPLTAVLPKQPTISTLVTAGLETVGVRVPEHPVAAQILRHAGVPIAAPSANRSGRPSCTTWRSVLEDLDGRIDAVYCEDGPAYGLESTVVDCCGSEPLVLRPGAVTLDQIRQVLPDAQEHLASRREGGASDGARSPGLLHPHYQPDADVRLVDGLPTIDAVSGPGVAYCGLRSPEGIEHAALSAVYPTIDEYAAGFYEFLREADRRSVGTVLVQRAPAEGIGFALRDRQRRAAGE